MPDSYLKTDFKLEKMTGKIHREIITTHMNADFDALSSMIAAKRLYPDAAIVFPGAQEKNLRNFFVHSLSYIFNFVRLKQVDLKAVERLILVDTRQKDRIGKFSEILDNDSLDIHIYDHHPESKNDVRGNIEIIKPLGSTTTILTEIIRDKGFELTPDEATVMYLGIHEDTGSFTFSSTTPDDHIAAAWLVEQGANQNLAADLLTREMTTEQVRLLNDLTQSAQKSVINGIEVVTAKVTREEYIGDFAVLVHKYMEMENIPVIFAMAQMENKIYMVARSRVDDVNVADIALAFGGGGHPQAASAALANKTLIQVEKELMDILDSSIHPEKSAGDLMTSPVIKILPEKTVKEASTIMTKYNINVLMVVDRSGKLQGYLTRQIMEKAVYFDLGHIPVKDYMNIHVSAVKPDTPLSEVQNLIINNKLRILPVMENGALIGVITRTDLMNILVGEKIIPDYLDYSQSSSHHLREKNLRQMIRQRFPEGVISLFMEFGSCADELGYGAYLVGGLVRDIFLKRDNLDVDIVIEGDGIHFAREFAKNHDVRIRSHKKFGTAVIIFPDGFKVDVATARLEYYESPAAPPTVETSSLKLDLYRRDFTINTLAVKLNGRDYGALIDYFGGQKDIKEKVIRVLHNLSFVEDPTRILRAIRFEQRFGFRIGPLTMSLIKNAVDIDCFKNLSGRRLFMELKLLLNENEPAGAIERMNRLNLIQFISPDIKYDNKLSKLLNNIKEVITWFRLLYLDDPFDSWKTYMFGLTAGLDPVAMNELASRFSMNDQDSHKMVEQHSGINDLTDRLFRMKYDNNYSIYTLLSQYDTEFLLFIMAKANSENVKKIISSYFTRLKGVKVSLKGRDLKEAGFKPGPLYKEIFDSLLEARLNNAVHNRNEEMCFVMEKFRDKLI